MILRTGRWKKYVPSAHAVMNPKYAGPCHGPESAKRDVKAKLRPSASSGPTRRKRSCLKPMSLGCLNCGMRGSKRLK